MRTRSLSIFLLSFMPLFFMPLFFADLVMATGESRSANARVNDSIVYHGKVVRPEGTPLEGSVLVRIKIYSPEPSVCLLWSEQQTVVAKKGGFSMELGYSENRIAGPNGGVASDFRSVFINNTGLTHASASCAVGSSYTPTSNDDRLMSAEFVDGGVSVAVEKIPIKSVPFAKQASEIAGFGIGNLFKISGAGSEEQFSPEEVTRLKAASAGGSANQILGIGGTGGVVEYKSITAGAGIAVTHTSNGIQISATGAGGTGTVTSVGVSGPPLSVSSATSNPVISISQASGSQAGYLSSADWTLFNSKQPAGAYLTSITGTQVMTALGFTPMSSTSPSEVISALGFTPQEQLGFTPVNRAGDAMTGSLALPSNGLSVGTSQLVVSGGNVGIGTSSPSALFEVSDLTPGGTAMFRSSANGITTSMASIATDHAIPAFTGAFFIGTPNKLALQTSITNNGAFELWAGGSSSTGYRPFKFYTETHPSVATAVIGHYDQTASASGRTGKVMAPSGAGTNVNGGSLLLSGGASTGSGSGGAVSFATSSAGSSGTLVNLPAERMRITSAGNVGIGTTTPGDKLHVAGKIRAQEICDESGGNCKVISGGWTAGSVTSVGVGGAPLSVVNGTSTPTISIVQANGSQAGFLSAADWTTFNNKQPAGAYLTGITGTQVTSALGYTPISSTSSSQVISAIGYTPQAALGYVPVSNALPTNQTFIGDGSGVAAAGFFGVGQLRNTSGTAQIPASCAASQTLTWSALTDVFNCNNIGYLPASAITTGTIDSARLPFGASLWQDAGSGKIHYSGGNIGVGTTTPSEKLEVAGKVKATELCIGADCRATWPGGGGGGGLFTVASGNAVDFANGQTAVLAAPGSSTLNLSNMTAGTEYKVIVEDFTSRTYTFSGCTNTYFSPSNGTTTGRTVYRILKTSSACYVSWQTSFGIDYTITIAANENNVDVRAKVDALGYDGVSPVFVRVIVNLGVNIGSTSTANAAFDTGPFPLGSAVELLNSGLISGRGGNGGNGGAYGCDCPGGSGGVGGPALRAQVSMAITNLGTIQGGGGGGSGGSGDSPQGSGGGGGGGAGVPAGSAGSGGGGNAIAGFAGSTSAGGNAGYGYRHDIPTAYSGGLGGGANASGGNGNSGPGAGGGGGGGAGAAGGQGGGWDAGPPAGAAAGAAVQSGNSNITWTTAGTRYGALNP